MPPPTAGRARACTMSMEFLIGRSLGNALAALDLTDAAGRAAAHYAQKPGRRRREPGRCARQRRPRAAGGRFLDSMATLGLPSFGYGIRYEFGMFAQTIQGAPGRHPTLAPDGTPGSSPPRHHYPVRFGGWVEHQPVARHQTTATPPGVRHLRHGHARGHGSSRVSTLRLWKAAAPAQIDLHAFNSGDYARAAASRTSTRTSPGCCTQRQHAGRARAAAAPGSSSRRASSRTSWRATWPSTRSPTWPTRWPSTSTTPTRPSRWPS